MKLADEVRKYYFANFDSLSLDKQFHFCSRLWLWSGDTRARQHLDAIYKKWAYGGNKDVVRNLYELAQNDQPSVNDSPVNAAKLRSPYFAKYPNIKHYNAVLSRINFLQSVYKQDFSNIFFEIFNKKEVIKLRNDLLNDRESLRILATYALNFIYNFSMLINKDPSAVPLELFQDILHKDYDITNKNELQLMIYFATHAILGESMFYRKQIKRSCYNNMIAFVEQAIGQNLTDVHLDNKFEFLVCAKLVGYDSSLAKTIWQEANKSLSPNGTFVIDRLNNNPQTARVDFNLSEHRNVLLIMSARPFIPTY